MIPDKIKYIGWGIIGTVLLVFIIIFGIKLYNFIDHIFGGESTEVKLERSKHNNEILKENLKEKEQEINISKQIAKTNIEIISKKTEEEHNISKKIDRIKENIIEKKTPEVKKEIVKYKPPINKDTNVNTNVHPVRKKVIYKIDKKTYEKYGEENINSIWKVYCNIKAIDEKNTANCNK